MLLKGIVLLFNNILKEKIGDYIGTYHEDKKNKYYQIKVAEKPKKYFNNILSDSNEINSITTY